MGFLEEIESYRPANAQEEADQRVILSFIGAHRENILTRDNPVAHITSSGFLMNAQLDKALLAHHNIRGVWAWTGGHADGNPDLLEVALQEAKEETGVVSVTPLSREIASIDILPVFGHWRKGAYVNAHLHLSVAYILICDEREDIRPQLAENTDVAWFPIRYFTAAHFDAGDVYLYNKLIDRAAAMRQESNGAGGKR